MIIDNIKTLLLAILTVLLLLVFCVSVDYADDIVISNFNNTTDLKVNSDNVTVVNGTYYVLYNNNGKAVSDGKIHTVKNTAKKTSKKINKHLTITVYGYPTCYTCWKTQRYRCVKRTYVNYCPNCKRYGTLKNNPKGVRDGEITCSRCDCDFCDCCGRDKVGSGGRHNWNILIPS